MPKVEMPALLKPVVKPAPEAELKKLSALAVAPPSDFVDYLKTSNGGGDDGFQIHDIQTILDYQQSDDYGLASLGLAYFATDGGGTAHCFRKKGKGTAIVSVSLETPEEQSTWQPRGTSFVAFARAIERERREAAGPSDTPVSSMTLQPVPIQLKGPLTFAFDHFAVAGDVMHFVTYPLPEKAKPDDRQEVRRVSLKTLEELSPICFAYDSRLSSSYGILAVSPDGKRLAINLNPGVQRGEDPDVFYSRALIVHDIAANKKAALWRATTKQPTKFCNPFEVMAFTRDGSQIISNENDQSVCLFDPATGKMETLGRHTKPITSLALSPDGHWAITSGRDKTLRVWDLKKRAEVKRFPPQKSEPIHVAWSPDGTRIFVVYEVERWSAIYDFSTGKAVCQLKGKNNSRIRTGVFTADSRRLVTAGSENTIDVRDAATGDLIAQTKFDGFLSYSFRIGAMAVTPDGRHVVYAPRTEQTPLLCWALPT